MQNIFCHLLFEGSICSKSEINIGCMGNYTQFNCFCFSFFDKFFYMA